jgi:hypothetical protein
MNQELPHDRKEEKYSYQTSQQKGKKHQLKRKIQLSDLTVERKKNTNNNCKRGF